MHITFYSSQVTSDKRARARELLTNKHLEDSIEPAMGARYKRLANRLRSFRSSPARMIEIGDRQLFLSPNVSGSDSYQFPLRASIHSSFPTSNASRTCSGETCSGFDICRVRTVLLEPCICSLLQNKNEQIWCVCDLGQRCIRTLSRTNTECMCAQATGFV